MKTDGELRKNKDHGFIQTFVSGEMDSNFAVENALLVGMAPFTIHGDPRWKLRYRRLFTERIGWNLPASQLFCRLTLREIVLLRLFKIEHPRSFVGDEPP